MGANGIYGLSGSGLDIESLVKMGMLNKQNQYDKMYQKEIQNTWLKEAYNDVYQKASDFRSAMSTYKMQSNMNAMTASTSNTNAVTATANGAAVAMTHQVSVDQVASNAYLLTRSGQTVTRSNASALPTSTSVKDVMFSSYSSTKDSEGNKKYIVNGDTGTLHDGSEVALSINLQSETDGKMYKLEYTYKQLFEDDTSLFDLAGAFAKSGANIQGNYDATTDAFSLYNKTSGADNIIGISANNAATANLLNNMHLGAYDEKNNTIGPAITFNEADGTRGIIAASSLAKKAGSDVMANVLGLSASLTNTGSGYSLEIKDKNDKVITTQTAATLDELNSLEVAKLKLSDGTNLANIKYTVADLFTLSETGAGCSAVANEASTLSTFADKITAAGLTDVTASYDRETDRLVVVNNEKDSTVDLNADVGSPLGLAFAKGINLHQSNVTQAFAGTNAKVKIDGKDYELSTNKQTVAGVTYNFIAPTDPQTTTKVTVTQDTGKIVEHVKNFVDAYNALIDDLNSKLSEPRYSDYKPLTKQQEAEMTETQIKKWNEKAKSGLLYHDNTIRALVSDMREAVYTPVDAVDSKFNSLSAIGISTSNVKGHITLNEDTLNKALAEDPDCVYQLFASDQDSAYIAGTTSTNKLTSYDKKSDYRNTGVANRLYNLVENHKNIIADYAGTTVETGDQSYLGKMITNLQTKMSSFKTQMNAYEKLLYKKYDAMEVALSKLGAQLGYITGYGN